MKKRSIIIVVGAIFLFPVVVICVVAIRPFFSEGFVFQNRIYRQWKEDGARREEPLPDTGGTVQPRDEILLDVEGERPFYLYAFSVDSVGNSHVLFPDSRLAVGQPLPAGVTHRLPSVAGDDSSTPGAPTVRWRVAPAAGSVLFFIYMSRTPLQEAEKVSRVLSPYRTGEPANQGGAPSGSEPDSVIDVRRNFRKIQSHMMLYKELRKLSGVWARRVVVKVAGA